MKWGAFLCLTLTNSAQFDEVRHFLSLTLTNFLYEDAFIKKRLENR